MCLFQINYTVFFLFAEISGGVIVLGNAWVVTMVYKWSLLLIVMVLGNAWGVTMVID